MNTKHYVAEESKKSDAAQREEAILSFWREHDIFNKSLEKDAPNGDYVFYDGPPFATGLPHYGHILGSAIKDAIPRFWTMNGYHVRRQWGWDCHGLPLENLIEKKLGLSNKRDIEAFGIKNFNEAARAAVMEYRDDWREIIPRMGRWADMEDDYKTMDSTYTESVWWVFKSLHEKGLVFESFKSMHLCPRCGTTLSNFEVNQGYKDIKDIAVTVKLPLLDEAGNVTDTSLLVWTTTPWTLPGNLAAAVHNDHTYAKVKVTRDEQTETVLLAKERLAQLGTDDYEVVSELLGSELVGTAYEPPFEYLKHQDIEGKENAWKIYHADYVELGEEGTGAVHLAPAYGEEDLLLAQREGIPIFHHVDYEGRFMDFVTDFAGQLVKPKDDDESGVTHLDADIEIVKALKADGRLFKKENIVHSYPHCWRDDTPLLNYATTSWFINVPKIKEALVAENSTVHWVPEHVGKNRFGKWLEGARDWAVSRQRYWGAPLPIWRNPKTKQYKVFGSLTELQAYVPKSGNTYLLMRHAESVSNTKHQISMLPEGDDLLTAAGEAQAAAAAATLPTDIDLIVHTGFRRTAMTADIVAKACGIPRENILVEPRLGEIQMPPSMQGEAWNAYDALFPTFSDRYHAQVDGYENRLDVRKRSAEWLFETDTKYTGKKILVIAHGCSLLELEGLFAATDEQGAETMYQRNAYFKNAEVKECSFTPFPHNDDSLLDFHRPYIDTIVLEEDGVTLQRVPDVFDCWFESGSMPYGQYHYPFSCEENFERELFPANFIAEGLDQTRGWFYSLIVLGTALFGKSPYENVIVNGLVLAEDGKKMSKSLQNYPDPMEVADRVGADATRFYLLSSPVVRGENLNFSEKEVRELQRKNLGRLHNVLAMYEQFAGVGAPRVESRSDSTHVLDRWITARLNELIAETTTGYQNYELDRATRPVTDFIDDLSVWYLRRSRDRLKGSDEVDKQATLATLRLVLQNLALVMAPAMPFYADYLWQRVKEEHEAESVHLASWPKAEAVDLSIINDTKQAREVVTVALEQRAQAKIKVRQPLPAVAGPGLSTELQAIVADELNVKSYNVDPTGAVTLNTTITPELQVEGDAREFMRQVQEMRKQAGLEPSDRITVTVQTSDGGEAVIKTHQAEIQNTVGADTIAFGDAVGEEIKAGEHEFTVELKQM